MEIDTPAGVSEDKRSPLASVSTDGGIVLAVSASALLLVGGVWAVVDLLQGFSLRVVRSG